MNWLNEMLPTMLIVRRSHPLRIPAPVLAGVLARMLASVLTCVLPLLSLSAEAAQCTASFPDGAQTVNNNGSIVFNNNALLFNSPDRVLDTWSITDNNTNTCFTADCTEANTNALALNPGSFLATTNNTDLTVPNNGSATLAQAQYDDVTVGTGAQLNSSSGISSYRFDNVTVNQNAILNLTAGDYWIDTLAMGNGSSIVISGSGTVRLFINDTVSGFGNNIVWNAAPASPSQLFVFGYNSLSFGNSMQLNGLIYSSNNLTIGQNSVFTGAATAANQITFGNNVQMSYNEATVTGADLGSLCTAASTGPIMEWRFEQTSWTGSSGEVLDESSNNQHGTALNGAQTDNLTPAISNSPGTCRYGDFDTSSNQSVQIAHNGVQNLDNSLTITAWIYLRSYNSGGLRSFLSKDSNYELHVASNGRLNWWWQNQSFGNTANYFSTGTVPLNTWTHVAFRFRPGEQRIFINGNQDSATLAWNGRLAQDTDPLQIGQDQGFAGRYWNGYIDEVRVYNRPLSNSEIAAVMAETHDCPFSVHHYELTHDGSGLTCAPESVTLRACTDASCSSQYSGSYSVTLTPSGWVGGSSQTFTGSPQTLSLWHATAETITLGISTATPAPTSALICGGGPVATPCALDFADSGFLIDAPDVTANKPSGLFTVSAVRKSDNATICVPSFANVSKSVQFFSTYVSPATGTLSAALRPASAGSFTTIAGAAPGTAIPLSFDGAGVAQVELHYADAGQLTLNASYSETNEGETLVMTGSDNVVARPAGFCVEAMQLAAPGTAQAACNDSSCPPYQKAGGLFPLRVRAMAWETDSDSGAAYCTGNAVTANFQGPLQLDVARDPTETDLTQNGTLGQSSLTVSSGGDQTIADQSVSEVGRFRIGARSSDYFGQALPVTYSRAFGRIYPDHYALTVDNYTSHCASGNFSYSGLTGDKIGEGFPLTVTVIAENAAGARTYNYHGAFATLNGAAATFADLDGGAAATDGEFVVAGHALTFSQGQAVVSPLNVSYGFSSTRAPYTIGLQANVLDSDGSSGSSAIAGPVPFRLGRLVLENAYGPEQLPLPVPLRAEYFDGTRWRRNTADNCTSYHHTSTTRDVFTGTLTDPETEFESPSAAQLLSTGVAQSSQPLRLEAPGLGEYGSLRVTLTVPSWLQFDWDGNGNHDNVPQATATFGRFRGSDRVIYWREQLPVVP